MTAGIDRPLDEARRRAYLHAMGIDLWVPRAVAVVPTPSLDAPLMALPGAPHPSAAKPASAPPTSTPPPQDAPPRAPHPSAAKPAPAPTTSTRQPASSPATPPTLAPPPETDDAWEPVWDAASDSAWEPVWEPEFASAPAPPPTTRPGSPLPAKRAAAHPTPAADPAPLLAPPAPLDWDALAAAVAGCRACELCQTRTQTVFGVGHRQARLLVIGEAPGADEDREGEPFVGRAGRLLNQMLAAIGLTRGEVYIANILKCRPPNNRNPHPVEVAHCHGYLARQVELIRPQVILSVGAISAQHLLGTDTPVGRLRGRWFDYGPEAIALRVTYHPAYLLRSPDQKAKAWEDLIEVARRLGADGRRE